MKPRIAIPVPTSADRSYNRRAVPLFTTAIERAGGAPVVIELAISAAELKVLLASCAGVCLPGSPADVDPARYAAQRDRATAKSDPAREVIDFALLDDAWQHGKPVLAVCFGLQSMNVWRGGTLVQDLTPMPINHAAHKVAVAHSVLVAEGSLLGRLIAGSAETRAEAPADSQHTGFYRLPINTSHHQAVAAPGDGLSVIARSPDDGVVEAVEANAGVGSSACFVLGVQWHPERSYDISAVSRAVFAKLVYEAERFAEAAAFAAQGKTAAERETKIEAEAVA